MPSRLARKFLRLQCFLLRRNLAGPMGDVVMVITTTGRKSGRAVSTPIGFIRDEGSYVALSYPSSHWYQNLRRHPEALLEVRGRPISAHAEFIDDEPGRQRCVGLYRQQRPRNFRMFFNVPLDAPPEALARGVAARAFVRFRPRLSATA